MKLSVLTASKNRIDYFKEWVKNVEQYNAHEVLIKLDPDDKQLTKYLSVLAKSKLNYKIVIYPQPYGWYQLNDVWNDLGNLAQGDVLWLWADDVRIKGDWIAAIHDAYNKHDDHIFVARNSSSSRGCPAAFLSCSKQIIEIIGRLAPNNPDCWLPELAQKVERLIEIDSSVYEVEHLHPPRQYCEKPPNATGELDIDEVSYKILKAIRWQSLK